MKNLTFSLRAQDVIAQGALTNSKRSDCFVKNVYQTHASHVNGPYLTDVDNHKLIDFICGLGSSILGYGNAQIAEAIYHQAMQGPTISMSTPIELTLAEKIREIVPWVHKVKFLKTGTEACMAAVKIARAKTGRKLALSDAYHGWSDEFVGLTPPALGINVSPYMQNLGEITPEVACVIVEPVITELSEERKAFLRKLREDCTRCGALLIFDEIITGFRTPKFTMSQFLDIEPDIICLGKAMGNGMPISCVAGKDHVMQGEYFVSSTFAGETCSIAASLKCIEQIARLGLTELWEQGEIFQQKFNSFSKVKLCGYPTRAVFVGDLREKALLWQEAYRAGILLGSSFFFGFQHITLSERVLNVLCDISVKVQTGSVELLGELPKSPFAQIQRGNK